MERSPNSTRRVSLHLASPLASVSRSSHWAFASSPYDPAVNVARSHSTAPRAVSTFELCILITTVDFRHTHAHTCSHMHTHTHTHMHTHNPYLLSNITVASQQVSPVYPDCGSLMNPASLALGGVHSLWSGVCGLGGCLQVLCEFCFFKRLPGTPWQSSD